MLLIQHMLPYHIVVFNPLLNLTQVKSFLSDVDGHGGVFLPVGTEGGKVGGYPVWLILVKAVRTKFLVRLVGVVVGLVVVVGVGVVGLGIVGLGIPAKNI